MRCVVGLVLFFKLKDIFGIATNVPWNIPWEQPIPHNVNKHTGCLKTTVAWQILMLPVIPIWAPEHHFKVGGEHLIINYDIIATKIVPFYAGLHHSSKAGVVATRIREVTLHIINLASSSLGLLLLFWFSQLLFGPNQAGATQVWPHLSLNIT